MIMLETVYLTITGGLIGLIVSALMVQQLSKNGIDLTPYIGQGVEAMGYSAHIYPELSAEYYFGTILLIVVVAMLSAIYPARKALKLNPADAIRSDA